MDIERAGSWVHVTFIIKNKLQISTQSKGTHRGVVHSS